MKARPADAGFTLLEILVAVTVLGLLVVGLTQGVRTGIRLWDGQVRHQQQTAELDATARVLRNVLTAIPTLPAGISGGAAAIAFKGEPNLVTFVGDLPTGVGGMRRADIAIGLKRGRVVMTWTPHFHETRDAATTPAPIETELIRNVRDLQFSYWGRAGPNSPAAWLNRWPGPALPELIRVRLGLAKGDPRHWPDLIAAPALASPSRSKISNEGS